MKLARISNSTNHSRSPISVGMVPPKPFSNNSKSCKLGEDVNNCSGMVPVREFCEHENNNKLGRSILTSGKVPLREFDSTVKRMRGLIANSADGSDPVILFCDKLSNSGRKT